MGWGWWRCMRVATWPEYSQNKHGTPSCLSLISSSIKYALPKYSSSPTPPNSLHPVPSTYLQITHLHLPHPLPIHLPLPHPLPIHLPLPFLSLLSNPSPSPSPFHSPPPPTHLPLPLPFLPLTHSPPPPLPPPPHSPHPAPSTSTSSA